MTIRRQTIIASNEAELTLKRRLYDLRLIAKKLSKYRMTPLQICEAIFQNRLLDATTLNFFSGLPDDEKHYWVASLYALMMPKARRRKLAAYFTPPHLAQYAIDALTTAGIKLGTSRILDPASGGAAFLIPLAARMVQELRQQGVAAKAISKKIESTLFGIEIEPQLAALSKILLANLLNKEIGTAAKNLRVDIQRADTLKCPEPSLLYDAVVGNPPYGRVFRPSKALLKCFDPVISDGYVNLYALFIEQALRWVKPGGIICLIVPVSFIGGPYFAALRKRILQAATVLRLDPIDKRSDIFLDVIQDVCVLVLRKKDGATVHIGAASSLLKMGEPHYELGFLDLPNPPSKRIWALPNGDHSDELFQKGLVTLSDYGYTVKTGYFVWNREQHRYRSGFMPRSNEVPLFWAHNVQANVPGLPRENSTDPNRVGFVKISAESSAIIHSDAVILQRTSNRRQTRRLIAAIIRKSKLPGTKGFVSENHTILIVPDPKKKQTITLALLCRLLNAEPVDTRFRRISGSVSVSTKALRELPLPAAQDVRAALKKASNDDVAIGLAYDWTLARARTEIVNQGRQ
jgi:adenine-specific DNA-methyltransferase